MQFRLTQTHIVIFNFLLIAGIAYFAARSVNDVILQSLQSAPALPPGSSMADRGPENHPRAYYDQIVTRDVFNLTPVEVAPPVVASIDLHIKLLGTSLATHDRPYAIIEDQNGDQALYTIGDDIPDAGKVLSIQKTRMIVLSDGQKVALDIPNDDLPAGIEAPAPAVPMRGPRQAGRRAPVIARPVPGKVKPGDDDDDAPDVNVEEEGENHYSLKRKEVKDAIAHSAQLFQEIHAMPNMENGKANGYTLSEIEPGSVFEDLGLQDGDQVTAIDGKNLQNPAEAVGLLSTIQTRTSLDLTVMRDGRPVQLHYDIR